MERASVIEFLPLQETQILLDLGFNEPYLGGFCHNINGSMGAYKILHQTALRWFRKNHNINIMYVVCGSPTKVLGYKWFVQVGMENNAYETKVGDYDIGLIEAIREASKLIKL